jgi:hypothetical protein
MKCNIYPKLIYLGDKMKHIYLFVFIFSLSITSSILFAGQTVSKQKINGPECTGHLMKALNLKALDAYQICSAHGEETKVCLIQNNTLSKRDLVRKCHQKK